MIKFIFAKAPVPPGMPSLLARFGNLVLWLVLFRTVMEAIFLVNTNNQNRCTGIFTGGSWDTLATPLTNWNAPDCTLHEYTRENVTNCFHNDRIVFVGDSTVRQLYWATTSRLNHYQQEMALLDFYSQADKTQNLNMTLEGVKIEYIYDPWMNSTVMKTVVSEYVGGQRPALLVLGTPGLWAARHSGEKFMEVFKLGVNNIRPTLDTNIQDYAFARNWPSYKDFIHAKPTVVVIPPATPFQPLLTPQRSISLTPERFEAMYEVLRNLPPKEQDHILWSMNEMMVAGGEKAYNFDGFHASRQVQNEVMSLIVSPRCNSGLAWDSDRSSPTCCVISPTHHYLYNIIFELVCVIAFVAMGTRPIEIASKGRLVLITGIGANILGSVGYAVMLDRWPILYKLPLFSSVIPPFILTAVLWTTMAWVRAPLEENLEKGHDEPVFLSRSQTDGIKGFLQVAIIMAGLCDSKSLWIHKAERLAGSIYVFLSVYGHSQYFFSKKDISWSRFWEILVRLNALNLTLSVAMLTVSTWHPLEISFWFTITFLTFRIKSSMNQNIFSFLFKLIIAFWIIQVPLVSYIFNPLGRSFFVYVGLPVNVPRIQAALNLHKLTPFPAMLLACITNRVSRLRSHTAKPNTGIAGSAADDLDDVLVDLIISPSIRSNNQQSYFSYFMTGVFSLTLGWSLYLSFAPWILYSTSEFDFWWPFVNLPIVCSLVYLRNCTARMKSLSFPRAATVGKVALEVAVLKNNALLAENGTGLVSFVRYGSGWGFVVMEGVQVVVLMGGLLYVSGLCRIAIRGSC